MSPGQNGWIGRSYFIFSPQLLQKLASGKTSALQLGQSDRGFSTFVPQTMQKAASGGRSLLQAWHRLITISWCPQLGQKRIPAAMEA
jgi:hypothetical protein